MPNIQQQKKRVRIPIRQRDENIRFRSTVKTLTKRLEAAVVEAGDAETVAAEHRTLVRWIDRAATKGAMHANTAARKKTRRRPPALVRRLRRPRRRARTWPPVP